MSPVSSLVPEHWNFVHLLLAEPPMRSDLGAPLEFRSSLQIPEVLGTVCLTLFRLDTMPSGTPVPIDAGRAWFCSIPSGA